MASAGSLLIALLLSTPGGSASDDPLVGRHAAADAVARGEAQPRSLADHGRKGLWALAQALERHPEPAARARLMRAAGHFDRFAEEALNVARRGLRSEAPAVRRAAIAAVVELDPPQLTALLMRLVDDPDARVRADLALALALSPAPRVEDTLRARASDPSSAVRDLALRFVALTGADGERRDALRAALGDPSAVIRRTALEHLRTLADPRYADLLESTARRAPTDEALLAVKALAELKLARPALRRILGDPEAPLDAARFALAALRRTHRHPLDLIVPAVSGLSPHRRDALIGPLLSEPTPGELRDLVALVDHPLEDRARLARTWLARIGARGDEALALSLSEARPARAAAIVAILRTRPDGGVSRRLLDMTRAGDVPTRLAALRAIGRLATPMVRSQLVDLLDAQEAAFRAAAAEVVADLPNATRRLMALTEAPEPEVRAAGVAALEHQLDPAAWQRRLDAVDDPAEMVRVAALRSLSGSSHPEALAQMELRAQYGSPRERRAAIAAIAKSRTTLAAITLVELVVDPDREVRRAALEHLERL